jgi:tRNA threonylcarbamoyladenosine biosynthesis protein TsaE
VEKILKDLDALTVEATTFTQGLKPKANHATLVTLSGELGAGKTTFVKAVAKALGVQDTVTSPTFVLEKIYPLPGSGVFARLIHIDAYRFEKSDEIKVLNFDEILKDPRNLVMLEWPEQVSGALPKASVAIALRTMPGDSRQITYG